MIMKANVPLLAFCLAASSVVVAAEPVPYRLPRETAELKAGPGSDVASAQCGLCHSVDYITTQPPGRGAAFWQASVTKMIHIYGAPVSEADAAIIATYLAANY
jgi:mono/diheme cytochrome c family protein